MITLDTAWLAGHPLPPVEEDTDKNRRGRVFAVGGSMLVPGALLLTGEAAFRAGAGKVRLATVEPAALPLGLRMPEAAVVRLPASNEGELSADAAKSLAAQLDECDALVLGPGMGPKADAGPILQAVLASSERDFALVIDAAALAAARDCTDAIRARPGRIVLTPHPGEMCALMDCDEARVQAEPEAVVREAAERFGATVVLKASQSWIASPGAEVLHYPGGGPGLATGGSGDVLAGVVGGLLARGADGLSAIAWAVWSHGEAGRALATKGGSLGFLARELPAEIRQWLNGRLR